MATTNFQAGVTPITADWLNDVNAAVYDGTFPDALSSASITYTQGGTGAVATTVQAKLRESVSVKDFGAVGDGVTDDTAAIQAALDCIPNYAGAYCPSKISGGAGEIDVFFPEGTYLVSSCLDMNQRGWQRMIGLGRVTITSTSTDYIVDMSSCWRCGIENIDFTSSTAGMGIFMTRCTSNPFVDYNEFRNVNITLSAGTGANGGLGTIGLWMNRIEQNLFYNIAITADCCIWNSPTGNVNFLPVSGTQDYVTNSNTVNTFIECNFTKRGSHQFCMVLNQCTAFRFYNCYWNDLQVSSGSTTYMWSLTGISECTFQGTFDSLIRLADVSSSCYYNNFDVVFPTASLSTGVFFFNQAGTHDLASGDIKIFTSGSGAGLYLFVQSAGTVSVRGNMIRRMSDLGLSTGTLTLSNNILQTEGSLQFKGSDVTSTGGITAYSGSAPASNGAGNLGLKVSSTSQLGVFVGVGTPGLSAAKGSLYLNTTGSSTSTRLYVNTDGGTGWTSVTTAT